MTAHFRIAVLLLLIFAGAVTAAAQERGRVVDGQYIPAPGEVERNERMHKILQKAESFALELTPVMRGSASGRERNTVSYPVGSKVTFDLKIINTAAETVEWRATDTLHQDRPRLVKDGTLVPYRKRVGELVNSGSANIFSDFPMSLEPGQTTTRTIDLGYWHEPLEPGVYTLTVSYRLVEDGSGLHLPRSCSRSRRSSRSAKASVTVE